MDWNPVITRLPDDRYRNVVGSAEIFSPPPAPTENDVLAQYIVNGLQIHNLRLFGCWFEAGYMYDYRGHGLKKYVFKQGRNVREAWGPDPERLVKSIKSNDVSYILPVPEEAW